MSYNSPSYPPRPPTPPPPQQAQPPTVTPYYPPEYEQQHQQPPPGYQPSGWVPEMWYQEVRDKFTTVLEKLDTMDDKLAEINGSVQKHERTLYGQEGDHPGLVVTVRESEQWLLAAETVRKGIRWIPALVVSVLTILIAEGVFLWLAA